MREARVCLLSGLMVLGLAACFSASLTGTVPATDPTSTNTAPSVNAGSNQNVDYSSTVQLDASGTSDADSDTLTYSWTQVSGQTVTLSNANIANPTFTAPSSAPGAALVFQVTVSDGTDSTSATVSVTVYDDPTQIGPFAGNGLDHINSVGSVTLAATQSEATYAINTPRSGTTVNITGDTDWNTAAGSAVFVRADEIAVAAGSHTIAANGFNGSNSPTNNGAGGNAGASGGGGGGDASGAGNNGGDGGSAGANGSAGAGGGGSGGTGAEDRDNYTGGFSFESGGAGGAGGNAEAAGGLGGSGGTAASGAGGGGGGGGGPNPVGASSGGAGGGGSGGLVVLIANRITGAGTLTLSAVGGDGGDASDPIGRDGGGGGGGGGGVIYVALSNYTAGQLTFNVSGGSGGASSGGAAGSNGSDGNTELCQIVDDGDGTYSLSCGKDPASDSW